MNHNKLLILLSITILFSPILKGKETDTLITIYEVRYGSEFEKEAINEFFQSDDPNYLKVFLASSGKINISDYQRAKRGYSSFFTSLNSQRLKTLKASKKIKSIYKTVHNYYFKKYEAKTSFNEIFETGIFNCLTATALYGITLHELNIPFVVRETPFHVYLVAYPNKEGIKIETTDPLKGLYFFDQKYKESFIEYLHKNKFISPEEYLNNTNEELFDKYFYSDKEITLQELIGLHYFNLSVFSLMDKKLREAYDFMERSYIFYSSERVRYLMFAILAEILHDTNYEEFDDLRYLARITRFTAEGIKIEDIKREFARITEYYLINRSNKEYYDKIYNYLDANIQNKEYKNEISFIYNYEKGRFAYNRGQRIASHEYFKKAYLIKPENSDVQMAFVQSLAFFIDGLDAIGAITKIEEYNLKFKNLETNQVFKTLLLQAYLVGAFQKYSMKSAEGDHYILKFENLYGKNRDINIDHDMIGNAYSSAGIFYFKKGDYKKAKEYINKGLHYAPNNFKLLMSKDSF